VLVLLVQLEGGQDTPRLFAISALLAIMLPMEHVQGVATVYTLLQDCSLRVMYAPQESIPRMGTTARAVQQADSLHWVDKRFVNLVEMEDL
jgi:hypothetical protein